MSKMSRFNPANNLYIKLFLWFWFATIIIVSGSAWIINQFDSETRFRPISSVQLEEVKRYSKLLQEALNISHKQIDLEQLLVQIGIRNQVGLILVEPTNKQIISGLPRFMHIDKSSFLTITSETPAISIDTGEGLFSGPGLVKFNGKNYVLFVGTPVPPRFMGSMRRPPSTTMFLITFSLSAILCFWFARSLVNPIRQLQHASQQMAAGNLTSRVGSASKRHDEIGRLGRDFNFMSEQVEVSLTSQKRLLADISHELRSPLTRLQLSIGIVQQQAEQKNDEFLRTSLDRIEKEAAQIENMIAQVLTISRLEHPQVLHDKQLLDLKLLMLPIISDAKFEAQEQNKKVLFVCPEALMIYGSSSLLRSAIENVLRNAIKYAASVIRVKVVADSNHITLVVEDDGEGIEEQELEHIFKPFYRESLARDRNTGGVGLGLAIAHRSVLQHQGTIEAENKAQGGLVVKMTLPTTNDEIKEG